MSEPIESLIVLTPMSHNDYDNWIESSISAYAEDKQKTHDYPPEEAIRLSRDSFQKELPSGVDTPGQHLFTIQNLSRETVGFAWFGVAEEYGIKRAFIFDIEITEAERGKGYGRAAMMALENEVKKQGINKIALHVFNFNETAKSLYQSLGYQITDLSMEKLI